VTTEPAFVFDIPQSPSPFTLHKMNCATASLVRQYLVHVYYVSTCDDCTQNDGIPTLKRVELSANSMITASLTQGIVDFRVEYGQDTGNDGAADAYRKCGADNACAAADWANVMVVKVYLLTRNMEPTPGYVDTKVYTMGLSGQLPAVGATERTYKHHVYASPIRVIGQSDLREMP
jgi:type IV pilus assembly protein PilW